MDKSMSLNSSRRDDDDNAYSRNDGVAPWSDLGHDVLVLVMVQLGVIEFIAFSGVCKSWRSCAHSNMKKFMASKPPMLVQIPNYHSTKECYLKDFEGRRFKTLISNSIDKRCVGLTCGYLVYYRDIARDFWLVNPITRHELHFPKSPDIPIDSWVKAILVFSPLIRGWVFVVLIRCTYDIWFTIEGKREWKHVPSTSTIIDLHAFKGKIYTLNSGGRLYEMRLNPKPNLILLEVKNYGEPCTYRREFVNLGENLYLSDNSHHPYIVYELDFGEMKWVSPEEKTIGEFAFFLSNKKHGVAIKPESWVVDPRSKYKSYGYFFHDTNDKNRKARFLNAHMWYFPHSCVDVDFID